MGARTDGKTDQVENGTRWHAAPDVLEFTAELSIYDRAVWHNFAAHANRKTGACFPSRDLQAKEIGCSRDKVSESRKRLLDAGWLEKETVIGKKGIIERYQWKVIVPSERRSASLAVCRSDGLPVRRSAGNEAANQKESKPNESKPNESKPNDIVAATAAAVAAGAMTNVAADTEHDGITQVFDIFRTTINPTVNFGHKTQRAAAAELIRKFGLEKTLRLAQAAAEASGQRYAPVITNPYQLKEKLGQLLAWIKKGGPGLTRVRVS